MSDRLRMALLCSAATFVLYTIIALLLLRKKEPTFSDILTNIIGVFILSGCVFLYGILGSDS